MCPLYRGAYATVLLFELVANASPTAATNIPNAMKNEIIVSYFL